MEATKIEHVRLQGGNEPKTGEPMATLEFVGADGVNGSIWLSPDSVQILRDQMNEFLKEWWGHHGHAPGGALMPSEDEKRQIANIGRQLASVVSAGVRGIATGVLDDVVENTPRDTGLSAASWRAKLGGPVTDVVGDRTASGVAQAQAAQDASRAQIPTWKKGTLSIGSAEVNVLRLNDGSSRQEPAGFVQRAVRKGVAEGTVAARRAATAASRRGSGG